MAAVTATMIRSIFRQVLYIWVSDPLLCVYMSIVVGASERLFKGHRTELYSSHVDYFGPDLLPRVWSDMGPMWILGPRN